MPGLWGRGGGHPCRGTTRFGITRGFSASWEGTGHSGFLPATANAALQDAGLGLKCFFPVTHTRVMAEMGWAVPRCRAQGGRRMETVLQPCLGGAAGALVVARWLLASRAFGKPCCSSAAPASDQPSTENLRAVPGDLVSFVLLCFRVSPGARWLRGVRLLLLLFASWGCKLACNA